MNALMAFAEFVEAHRQGRPPSPIAFAFIVTRLKDYMDHNGARSLDEVFEVRAAGPGRRDPWMVYLKDVRASFYCHMMAQLIGIGFTVDEAAEAVATRWGSLRDMFGRDMNPQAAGTARSDFYDMGGIKWAKKQEMYAEGQAMDDATRAALIGLIPEHARPIRFKGCDK